jgi:hypothetical protein
MQVLARLSSAERITLIDIDDVRPAVWIVADEPESTAAMQAAAAGGGARISRIMRLDEAATVIGDRPYGTLLMLDVGELPGATEARLLDHIDLAAADHLHPAVVSFPMAAIDRVTAAVSAPYASLLCAPSVAERAAAIGLARVPAHLQLQEADATVDTMRLQQLAEEVGRIARVLSSFSNADPADRQTAVSDGLIGYRAGPAAPRVKSPQVVRADDIRAMLRLRRQRDHMFAGELFADPAWDMILDLMAARIERLKVAVSSLCIAAAVPPTTALRWIRTLTELGIFVRVADPTDGRRVFIELSDAAAGKVLDFLGEAKRLGAALV